jgi:hypothetical protein
MPHAANYTPTQTIHSTGDIFVRGDIRAADVSGSGTSTITLSGVHDSVYAQLSGASKLYVDAASGVCVAGCTSIARGVL